MPTMMLVGEVRPALDPLAAAVDWGSRKIVGLNYKMRKGCFLFLTLLADMS